ncbi:hypothetical protein AB0L53_31355 [Nonomuraea sp. NPDC052129]|uniref:hypothetical protein n=1 Tax=Nonomuraea sp. NPDC052129 TaxID=3154651 RepID=UPI0034202F77
MNSASSIRQSVAECPRPSCGCRQDLGERATGKMTEQTFTVEQGSGTKLLATDGFLALLFAWADENLDTIAKFWAMPGEGWEDSLRTALSTYIEGKHPWADLGAPQTRAVYVTKKPKPKQADFVLNGTVAGSSSDKVIVEVKTQSLGRLKDFKNDFEADIAKLDEVDTAHTDCARLALGVFFTSDWTQSKKEKGMTVPAENAEVSTSFTEWLDEYDHVYFSETYKPIKRAAGTQTDAQKKKAGAIYREKKSTTGVKPPAGAVELAKWDVHELGIVYKLLPSKKDVQEALERARLEAERARLEAEQAQQEDEESSDSIFETPSSKRKNDSTSGGLTKKQRK